ncbi:SRPBCC family protein [bacterium]|nr:SRPBCC family protein [bacterium]
MKILKWLLGILAALAVVFFLIGVFVPSFSYETQIVVDRPVEHAFAVFTDESKMGDWMTGFKSIETISGNPNEVGSQYRVIIEENGEEMEMIETVTAFEKNKLFAFKLLNDLMYVDAEIKFSEEMGKTKITSSNQVEGRNILWKSMLPLFKSSLESRSQQVYENLKQLIEKTNFGSHSSQDLTSK